jgi:hypothetical protein
MTQKEQLEDIVDRACNFYIVHANELLSGNEQFLDIYSQKFVLVDIQFIEDIENIAHEIQNEGGELCDFNADDFRRSVIAYSGQLRLRNKNHTHILALRKAVARKVSQDMKQDVSYSYTPDKPYQRPQN